MQTGGIGLCFREWIFRYCRIYCFETEKENVRFKAITLFDLCGYLFGEFRRVFFGTLEDSVAALDISSDFFRTDLFEQNNKRFHRQRVIPANIDTSEKCNVSIHASP